MAQTMSVDDVLRHIRKASLFIEGITVSGGEATTQLPFIVALFTAIKADPQLQRLTCTVDSNGQLSETGWQKLLPVCDGVMLDLKARKSECHHRLTGRDNTHIKHSIRFLAAQGKLAELRLLVIPGQVDYAAHIDSLAAFITSLGEVPVRLNAFHAHGVYGEAKARQRDAAGGGTAGRRIARAWGGEADFAGAIFVSVACRTAAAMPSEPKQGNGIAIQRIGYHLCGLRT